MARGYLGDRTGPLHLDLCAADRVYVAGAPRVADEPDAVGRPHVPDRSFPPEHRRGDPSPTALAGAPRTGDLFAERLQ